MDRTDPADTVFRRLAVKLFAPAASVLTVTAGLLAWHFGAPLLEPGALRAARAAHAEWEESGGIEGARALRPAELLGGLRRVGAAPHLPDLAAAGFIIARISVVGGGAAARVALHVGYRSPEPCLLTLWIRHAGSDAAAPLEHYRGEAATWRTGQLDYALVSTDLRRELFQVIADIARKVTVAGAGPSAEADTVLRMSAMLGPRCGGNRIFG